MAFAAASASITPSYSSQLLPRPKFSTLVFPSSSSSSSSSSYSFSAPSSITIPYLPTKHRSFSSIRMAAAKKKDSNGIPAVQGKAEEQKEEQVVEEEEDLPWIQEKALDLVEFTGSVTHAIPGPRVGSSSLPWILALPLAYAGLTFVVAFVKTVKKFTSPRAKRRKLVSQSVFLVSVSCFLWTIIDSSNWVFVSFLQVNKNAMLCKSIDEFFHKGRDNFKLDDALKELEKKV